jgi:hypothetical protein
MRKQSYRQGIDIEEDEEDTEVVEWPEDFGEESKTQKQFKKAMLKAGYPVQTYRGRFFYKGWAARVPQYELQDAIRATRVKVQYDNLGFDFIMYPVQ